MGTHVIFLVECTETDAAVRTPATCDSDIHAGDWMKFPGLNGRLKVEARLQEVTGPTLGEKILTLRLKAYSFQVAKLIDQGWELVSGDEARLRKFIKDEERETSKE